MNNENPYKSPAPSPAAEVGPKPRTAAADAGEAFEERLTTVATYFEPIQADLARSRLGDEGIPAFIQGGEFASMAWHLTLANQGVKVQVPTEHAERALAILSDTLPAGASQELGDEDWPQTDENEASFSDDREAEAEPLHTVREQNADRAFRGAVIGLLFLPLQFYVFWLLLKVFVSDESLSKRSRNRALVATAISLPMTILLCLLLRKAFRN
jgi:Putative prokaryotic signal transducing protein